MAIDAITDKGGKKLKALDHYLKPLRRSASDDGSAEVAALLDRKIAKQQRAASARRTTEDGD